MIAATFVLALFIGFVWYMTGKLSETQHQLNAMSEFADAMEAKADGLESELAASKASLAVTVETLERVEQERAQIADMVRQWSESHDDQLDNPVSDALLDLAERLRTRDPDSDSDPDRHPAGPGGSD
jgi:hypothetical protein